MLDGDDASCVMVRAKAGAPPKAANLLAGDVRVLEMAVLERPPFISSKVEEGQHQAPPPLCWLGETSGSSPSSHARILKLILFVRFILSAFVALLRHKLSLKRTQ